MAYVVPAGKVTWEGSSSEDVVGYRVYYNMTGEDPVYTDPYVEFGSDVREAVLPFEGMPMIDGEIAVGVAAVDDKGNVSDMVYVDVPFDMEPPAPPASAEFVG